LRVFVLAKRIFKRKLQVHLIFQTIVHYVAKACGISLRTSDEPKAIYFPLQRPIGNIQTLLLRVALGILIGKKNYLIRYTFGTLSVTSSVMGIFWPGFIFECVSQRKKERKDPKRNTQETMQEIPLLGFGTWKIPNDKTKEMVYRAIKDAGIRHIDCASDYGNEKEVGEGIKQAIDEKIVTREELWITSKLWNTYHKEEHVLPACQRSLNDLQLTYLDLYLIHFPIAVKYVPFETRYPPAWCDPNVEKPTIILEENAPLYLTWKAMEKLVDQGVCRHIGVANFNVVTLLDMISYARIRPYANQVELHPYLTQDALVSFCNRFNIKVTAYSPFGSQSYLEIGVPYNEKNDLLKDPTIRDFAAGYNKSTAQILLKYHVQRGINVIPKSSNIDHLRENTQILDFTLTEQEV
jgi:D-xylose reductase